MTRGIDNVEQNTVMFHSSDFGGDSNTTLTFQVSRIHNAIGGNIDGTFAKDFVAERGFAVLCGT